MYENNSKNNLIASRQLSRYPSHVDDGVMNMESVWCRLVYSDFENMLAPSVWHSVWELQYCLEGEAEFVVREESFTVHEGEFMVIPPKVFHSTVRVGNNTKKFVFAFTMEAKNSYLAETLEDMQKNVRVLQGGEYMRPLISMMLEYAYAASPLSGEAIRNLCELMLFEYFRRVHPTQEERTLKIKVFESDRRVNDITTFIRENLYSGINVQDVAEYLHICVRHINRIAKFETGYTVTELINNEKISCIKQLLRSDMSLHDIAVKVNFSSEYTLNRFFKRHEGMSIGAWRKCIEK